MPSLTLKNPQEGEKAKNAIMRVNEVESTLLDPSYCPIIFDEEQVDLTKFFDIHTLEVPKPFMSN